MGIGENARYSKNAVSHQQHDVGRRVNRYQHVNGVHVHVADPLCIDDMLVSAVVVECDVIIVGVCHV